MCNLSFHSSFNFVLFSSSVGVAAAVATLQGSRTRVVMVTGDAKDTALSIATSLGFYDPIVKNHLALSGHETETMTAEQLTSCVSQVRKKWQFTTLFRTQ